MASLYYAVSLSVFLEFQGSVWGLEDGDFVVVAWDMEPNYSTIMFIGFLRGRCPRGGSNWGTLRIIREDWGNHHPPV